MLRERGVKPTDVIGRFGHEIEVKELVEELIQILIENLQSSASTAKKVET